MFMSFNPMKVATPQMLKILFNLEEKSMSP